MRAQNSLQVLSRAKMRHLAMTVIRNYFAAEDFWEIDSPLIIPANCVEAYIDPISVKVSCGEKGEVDRYLHTSPEVYHKRLLSHGAEKIYQLGHVFRDGELGRLHLPEFTLLEWYRAKSDLSDLITDCENLFALIANALIGTTKIQLSNQQILDLSLPFEQITMEALWHQHANIDLRSALLKMQEGDDLALVKAAQKTGILLRENATFDDVFHHVMLSKIEPKIGMRKPCVVLKWPIQMAALAKPCEQDLLFAERFEIYAGQIELANAFQELIDPKEQHKRFQGDRTVRAELGKKDLPIPEDLIRDLSFMPEAAGIAVGFDRLLMLILQTQQIDQVHALPNFFINLE